MQLVLALSLSLSMASRGLWSLPVAGSDRYTLDPTKLVNNQGEFSTENIFAVSETQIVVLFPGFE
jgi:hypothetical protein